MSSDFQPLPRHRVYRVLAVVGQLLEASTTCYCFFSLGNAPSSSSLHGYSIIFAHLGVIIFLLLGGHTLLGLYYGVAILTDPRKIREGSRNFSLGVYMLEAVFALLLAGIGVTTYQYGAPLRYELFIWLSIAFFAVVSLLLVYGAYPYEPPPKSPEPPPATKPIDSNDEIESSGTWDQAKPRK